MGFQGFIGIFWQNLRMQYKEVGRNLLLTLVPVVVFFFVYIFFTANQVTGDFISPIKMAVVDDDHTIYSDMLVESLRENDSFSSFVEVMEGIPKDHINAFDNREIDALITVPEGFIEGLATSEAMPLDVRINYDDPVKAILFKNVITSYEGYVRSVQASVLLIDYEMWEMGVPNELRWSWRDRSLVRLVFVALARQTFFEMNPVVNVPSVASAKYYFISLMVMFLMFIAIYAAISLLQEREAMCLSRLRTADVSMVGYITAKAMAITAYICSIVLAWSVAYRIFYGPLWSENGLLIGMFLFLCIYFDVILAMFFTLFFDGVEPVVLLSSIFIFYNAVVGGSIIPIHRMPLTIQRLADFSPSYWMIRGVLFLDVSFRMKEISLIAMGMLLMAAVLTVVTGIGYKKVVRI